MSSISAGTEKAVNRFDGLTGQLRELHAQLGNAIARVEEITLAMTGIIDTLEDNKEGHGGQAITSQVSSILGKLVGLPIGTPEDELSVYDFLGTDGRRCPDIEQKLKAVQPKAEPDRAELELTVARLHSVLADVCAALCTWSTVAPPALLDRLKKSYAYRLGTEYKLPKRWVDSARKQGDSESLELLLKAVSTADPESPSKEVWLSSGTEAQPPSITYTINGKQASPATIERMNLSHPSIYVLDAPLEGVINLAHLRRNAEKGQEIRHLIVLDRPGVYVLHSGDYGTKYVTTQRNWIVGELRQALSIPSEYNLLVVANDDYTLCEDETSALRLGCNTTLHLLRRKQPAHE